MRRSHQWPGSTTLADNRTCGTCSLCCTALGVHELNKPEGVPCEHLTPQGCGIYEDRPRECREFACTWLMGYGDMTQRPNRTGYVPYPEGPKARIILMGARRKKLSRHLKDMMLRSVGRTGAAIIGTPGHREVWTRSQAYAKEATEFAKSKGMTLKVVYLQKEEVPA